MHDGKIGTLRSYNEDEKEKGKKTIDSRSEIYGGCRHKTRLHTYTRNTFQSSTVDGVNPEKVNSNNVSTATSPATPFGGLMQYCQVISRVMGS